MLKLYNEQQNQLELWETFLPEFLKKLPEELALVDEVLRSPEFVSRFERKLLEKLHKENVSPKLGRPTTAIATYVRLMYLKFRYQLGYETLLKEVSDSFHWRRFCGISLYEEVPDDTCLIKLTNRFGQELIDELNYAVICEVKERKIIKGKKMRLDTTVTSSNIHYPTQSNILADGVRVITRTIEKVKKFFRTRIKFVNRLRSVKNTLRTLNKFSRTKTSNFKTALREKIVSITKKVIKEAEPFYKIIRRSRKHLSKSASKLVNKLKGAIDITKKVISQTKEVLSGNYHIPGRIVSIFDPEAKPITKGKTFPKTEFGRDVLIQESEKAFITNYKIFIGNPGDATLLLPSIKEHKKIFGHVPEEIATDRGFHNKKHLKKVLKMGVKHLSTPVRGRKNTSQKTIERTYWFRRLQKWRSGGEALISLLKRKFGLGRTLVRGTVQTAIWIGYVVFTYNLWHLTRLDSS